jgi:glycosyltransferase involved in cell wall biosynthesis
LVRIDEGEVKDGDVIFLQDYWTPGIEALMYALHLHGLHTPIYAMCHAQSVDEYDFTHAMLPWIRHYELGLDSWIKEFGGGIFVASTIHKKELRAAGFKAPIHVVGLPIDCATVNGQMHTTSRERQVIFCSRMDKEKNPEFMLEVAGQFLPKHPDWKWVVTTSANDFGNYGESVLGKHPDSLFAGRLLLKRGLSKTEYYVELRRSAIQFNCSSQDYVSWTLLEACLAGCDLCYPSYRSFKECVPLERRYKQYQVLSAVQLLSRLAQDHYRICHYDIPKLCDIGRMKEAEIVVACQKKAPEYNLWKEEPLLGVTCHG